MAIKQWQDIVATEINRDSPVTEALITKFHNNQECLISTPVDIRFASGSHIEITSASYVPVIPARAIYIPEQAGTDDGDVELVVGICAWIPSAGNDGAIRVKLGGGAWVTLNVTATALYQNYEIRIAAGDVKVLAGTASGTLQIEGRINVGSWLRVYGETSTSRLERVV